MKLKKTILLRHAITEQDKTAFDRLLKQLDCDEIQEQDQDGTTVLMVAIKYLSSQQHGLYFITRLLEKGAKVNLVDKIGFCAMSYAIDRPTRNVAYSIIRLLLKYGQAWHDDPTLKVHNSHFRCEYLDYMNRYFRLLPLLSDEMLPMAICVQVHRFLE